MTIPAVSMPHQNPPLTKGNLPSDDAPPPPKIATPRLSYNPWLTRRPGETNCTQVIPGLVRLATMHYKSPLRWAYANTVARHPETRHPGTLMAKQIGYARVSTKTRITDRQQDDLLALPICSNSAAPRCVC